MNELRYILLACGVLLLIGIFLWGRRGRGQAASADDTGSARRMDLPMMDEGFNATDPAHEPLANDDAVRVAGRWRDDESTSTLTDLPEIRADSSPAPGFVEPVVNDYDETDVLAATDEHEALTSLAPERATAQAELHQPPQPAAASAASAPRPRPSARPRAPLVEKRKILTLRLSAIPPERFIGYELRQAMEELGLEHGKYGIFHRLHGSESILSIASMVEPGAFDLETMDDAQFAGVTLFALLPGPLPGPETCDQLIECAEELERRLGGELQDERGHVVDVHSLATMRDEVLDFEHLIGQSGIVRS